MEKPSANIGDAPYVFVCYAHDDAASVYPEIAWLQAQGVDVWYDEGITPGHEWSDELASAIQHCSRFLYCVTPNSVASEHCRRELNFAHEERRTVVAVHLEHCDVPPGLRLSLNNRQAIFKQDLVDKEYRKRLMKAARADGVTLQATDAHPSAPASPRRLVIASIVVALGAIFFGVWWSNHQGPEAAAETQTITPQEESLARPGVMHNSIAVLPFENLSPDPDNAYFAAGIHEEILHQLSKIKDLSVIARATMVRFADSKKSIPTIAEELNVGTVMSGSVRYAGDRVRISTQLIDTASGAQLWSEAYEEDLEEIFAIQLSIATQIANALQAELSTSERARIAAPATESLEAYGQYLRALSRWGNYAPTAPVHEALDSAIVLDPQFAAALAFKAFVHTAEALVPDFSGPSHHGAENQRRLAALAEQYAHRALSLDDDQAHAHYSLGWINAINRRWKLSEEHLIRAYALNTNDYIVANGAAWARAHAQDCDGAVEAMEHAIALNPDDIAVQGNFAELLIKCEMWDRAKQQATLVTTLGSGPFGHQLLAEVESFLGNGDAVHVSAEMADVPGFGLGRIANAYQRIQNPAGVARTFEIAGSHAESVNVNPEFYFYMQMANGNIDSAIRGLERAIEVGFPWSVARDLRYFSDHPKFDPIRAHPKFEELVRRSAEPFDQD